MLTGHTVATFSIATQEVGCSSITDSKTRPSAFRPHLCASRSVQPVQPVALAQAVVFIDMYGFVCNTT
jgi:hypothetical protein